MQALEEARAKAASPTLREDEIEHVRPMRNKGDGLMYIDLKVNGKPIRAMVDTGATHNYLSSSEVERLGLVLEKSTGRVKAINSAAQPIIGVAKGIVVKAGSFSARTSISAVKMDDFKLIIGMEFLRENHIAVYPYGNRLIVLGRDPCLIQAAAGKPDGKTLSAIQLEKGLKHGETTYLAHLRGEEVEEVSK